MMRFGAYGIRVSVAGLLLLIGSLVVSIPRSVHDIQARASAQVQPESEAPGMPVGGTMTATAHQVDTLTKARESATGVQDGPAARDGAAPAAGGVAAPAAHARAATAAPDAGGPAAADHAAPTDAAPGAPTTAAPTDAAPTDAAPTAAELASPTAPALPTAANMVLGVRSTGLVTQITGLDAPHPTGNWGVHGTDLGHMFWHRDSLYMVFGDTFGEGGRERGRHWRSNVLARVSAPGQPGGGMRVESMITGPDGLAREVLPSMKVDGIERTVIPTNGISTGDRMFLHYMSIRTWHHPGHWDVGHSGLAYSDDDGVTWVEPARATWPGNLGFEQVAFVRHEGHVYSFGIPSGRYGDVKLRRVAEDRMLDPLAYEYWTKDGWASAPRAAVAVAPAPAGELSVAWNATHGKWMMMYLHADRHAVVLRLAPELTGPWGPEQVVVSGRDQPGLYAPYIVPLRDIGDEVLFTMSKWAPYNVYLMRMTLGGVSRAAH